MDLRHAEQYGRGSGRELDGKMRALRSSSAMTFSLIGNGSCVIGENDLGLPQASREPAVWGVAFGVDERALCFCREGDILSAGHVACASQNSR